MGFRRSLVRIQSPRPTQETPPTPSAASSHFATPHTRDGATGSNQRPPGGGASERAPRARTRRGNEAKRTFPLSSDRVALGGPPPRAGSNPVARIDPGHPADSLGGVFLDRDRSRQFAGTQKVFFGSREIRSVRLASRRSADV